MKKKGMCRSKVTFCITSNMRTPFYRNTAVGANASTFWTVAILIRIRAVIKRLMSIWMRRIRGRRRGSMTWKWTHNWRRKWMELGKKLNILIRILMSFRRSATTNSPNSTIMSKKCHNPSERIWITRESKETIPRLRRRWRRRCEE